MSEPRVPLVAGNWKMNTTVAEAASLAEAVRARIDDVGGVDKVVCPPFISLTTVYDRLAQSTIAVGVQAGHPADRGAFTGEVSMAMIADLARYAIVGHSERRQHFGETDADANARVASALLHGIIPILCVGETLAENEAGRTGFVVERQIRGALDGIPPDERVAIAYEPIWAIGTGRAATGAIANAVGSRIRAAIADGWGVALAERVRVLYGGSVTAANIAEFVAQENVDGALVGGASLRADEFAAIARATAEAKGRP